MGNARALCGDVRECLGERFVVLRTKRGRGSTWVVVGRTNSFGVTVAEESRLHAEVAAWRLVGRGRISIRSEGGYYFKPKSGALPSDVPSRHTPRQTL